MFVFVDNELISRVSDRAPELLHQIAGDLNKSKRQIFLIISISA